MSAPTAALEYLLARAAVRADGLLHIVSERNSAALNCVCGANPIRSKVIERHTTVPLDLTLLCADCAALALRTPGVTSIEQGLAVWIGTDAGDVGTRLLELPVGAIALDGDRAHRDEVTLPALAASIAEHGVLQPVTVRHTVDGYELVLGARRLAAARLAGLTTIPALVRDVDDEQAILDSLTENLHRADLNPIDQALAYSHALEVLQISQAELARRLEISQPQISNTVRLLALPSDIQDLVASGAVSAAQARELLRLDDDDSRAALAAQIVAEGLTVRETAARRAAVTASTSSRADFSQLLADLRSARVLVSLKGDRARITIDVQEGDVDRVLEQLERLGGAADALAAA